MFMKLRKGNKKLIRDINRTLIINEIRLKGTISRTDISKNLNLGLSTVTNVIEELKSQRFVEEVGESDSTGGRRPILLQFNYNYGYIIGAKIEENNVKFVLTNLNIDIIYKEDLKFSKDWSNENVIKTIAEKITEIKKVIPKNKNLLGIGIAVSGLVDQNKGELIYSGMLNWKNIKIAEILQQYIKVPVYVDNNVNVYTLAELLKGKGKILNNFMIVTYGAGVGAGIVINNRLYRGDFGGAGELGHTVLFVEGKECECGQRGCLEAYASDRFVEEYIKENIQFYNKSTIDINEDLSIKKVYEYAKKGDILAANAIRLSSKYFAYGLLSAVNLFNPSTIILAGEGMAAEEIVMPIVKDIIKNNFFRGHSKKIDIKVSNLGDNAYEIGASALVVDELFQAPLYYENQNSTLVSN